MGQRLRFVRTALKYAWCRPRHVTLGRNSFVHRPWIFVFPKRLRIGSDSVIRSHCYISMLEEYGPYRYSPGISIGDGVYVGRHAYFVAMDSIVIESGSVLSEHVYITDHFHGMHPGKGPLLDQKLESRGPVRIGRNSFIGYRVAIMPGVTLGEHCVVGANSVVTRSFPAYSMVVGSPARLIKTYDHERAAWISAT